MTQLKLTPEELKRLLQLPAYQLTKAKIEAICLLFSISINDYFELPGEKCMELTNNGITVYAEFEKDSCISMGLKDQTIYALGGQRTMADCITCFFTMFITMFNKSFKIDISFEDAEVYSRRELEELLHEALTIVNI